MRQLLCIILILHYLAGVGESAGNCHICENVREANRNVTAFVRTKGCSTMNGQMTFTPRMCNSTDDYCVFIGSTYYKTEGETSGPKQKILESKEYTVEIRDCLKISKPKADGCYDLMHVQEALRMSHKTMDTVDENNLFHSGTICMCKGDLCNPTKCNGLTLVGYYCFSWLRFGLVSAAGIIFAIVSSIFCFFCTRWEENQYLKVGNAGAPSLLFNLTEKKSNPEGPVVEANGPVLGQPVSNPTAETAVDIA